MRNWTRTILGFASFFAVIPAMHAQAVYTASRSGRIEAGAGYMYLHNDYVDQANYGLSLWGDYDFTRLIGAEIEAHFGGIITPRDIGENAYLVGPRFSYRKHGVQVYGKVMFGRGTITNQVYDTSSSYNAIAGGGGVEYRILRKIKIRGDVEEQKWPGFQPRTLSPLSVTVGAMYVIH